MLQKHFMLQKHTKPICEICSKITISTLNRFHTLSGISIINLQHVKVDRITGVGLLFNLQLNSDFHRPSFFLFVCLFVFCLVDKDNQTMKCGQLIVNRVEQKKYFSLGFMPKMRPGD